MVGNAIGSCVFNILLVLGVAAIVSSRDIVLSDDLLRLDLPVMVAVVVARLPLAARDRPVHTGAATMTEPTRSRPTWTFLTNHAHVMIALARDPELRQRDIAELVGITEGAVQKLLHDLEDGGYIRRERVGRRNRYEIEPGGPLRHPLEQDHSIGDVLASLQS